MHNLIDKNTDRKQVEIWPIIFSALLTESLIDFVVACI